MKIRSRTTMLFVCAFAVLMMPVQLSAQDHYGFPSPTLTEFDATGAGTASGLGTQAFSNNDEGAIVGTYTDVNMVYHGFLRTPDGKFIALDAPGAGSASGSNTGTTAYSINDLGVITGAVDDSDNTNHGFVRYPDGHYCTFDAPGAGVGSDDGTIPIGINLLGTVAGEYFDTAGTSHGFVRWIDGHIATFDAPDAAPGPAGLGTFVSAEASINLEGAVTGYYYDASNSVHGFVRYPDGHIKEFDAPGASPAPLNGGTLGYSINQEGTIAGFSVDANGVGHGFLRTREGEFTTIDEPDASTAAGEGTGVFSINFFGAVAGSYFDVNSAEHGFSRSAHGNYVTIDAPDAGTGAGQGTQPSTNNAEGAIAGWYIDGNNVYHGFVWTP